MLRMSFHLYFILFFGFSNARNYVKATPIIPHQVAFSGLWLFVAGPDSWWV
jgi:hypothetical protein